MFEMFKGLDGGMLVGGWRDWAKQKKREKTHGQGQQCGDCMGGGSWGCGEINGGGGRPDLGWWTHSTVYRWVLWNCAPETCVVLLSSVTPQYIP